MRSKHCTWCTIIPTGSHRLGERGLETAINIRQKSSKNSMPSASIITKEPASQERGMGGEAIDRKPSGEIQKADISALTCYSMPRI